MSNRRRFHLDITSIHRRPNIDEFPRHFHVLFRCILADLEIHIVSTYFFQRNFDGRKTHVVSTYFFRCNLMVEKLTLFSPTFFNVISLVEKSTLFLLTFFNLILMVEKSTLFTNTFFDKILTGRNSTSFLVKLEADESIWQCFPLKKWLL